jgi:6-phosphogluconate dehydrogenase
MVNPSPETRSDVAVIGLAVMGQNLVLNLCDRGHAVAVLNRTPEVTRAFVAREAQRYDGRLRGCESLADLIQCLSRPRSVLLLVKAGDPVDEMIESLLPLLEPDDIVVDLGNSHFHDTERRAQRLRETGLRYVGSGISGGEDGARHGPSLMPGGDAAAWPHLEPMFTAIAARADDTPCVTWIGAGGSGHFVKMVHNGIEYGDMQLICEAFDLMHRGLGLSHQTIAEHFRTWNSGPLESYLVEITADILTRVDERGTPLVETILDTAGQKGTGKWTGIEAFHEGVPVALIAEAVYARCLSALRAERTAANRLLRGPEATVPRETGAICAALEQALYAAKIVSYAQGFMLMQAADRTHGWGLDPANIAAIWRGGCIIRSRFLDEIRRAFDDGDGSDLMLSPFFSQALNQAQTGWRDTVRLGIELGIPMPAFASGLSFYDGYRSDRLPANLLQAQRDYFGAHGYERVDRPRGEWFHTQWLG